MYLISPNKKQYKANLHCHSTISDGKLTPEALKEAYKSRGYSVLAITDHEVPCAHNELTEDDFLMLTGYEAYIRQRADGRYDRYLSEIHLNLFAKDPKNELMICYNPNYCKYISQEKKDALKKAGSEKTREYSPEYINEFIKTAKDNGYIVAYNHPYWSMEGFDELMSYEGCFSMEMINFSSYVENCLEHNGQVYDALLTAGKRIFCHGADDNHNNYPFDSPYNDSFGGATVILADELKYDKIIGAMESGEMYSTMGPEIKEVSFDGENIHIECSEAVKVLVYYGSKKPSKVYAQKGESITSADFAADKNLRYIRVSVIDKDGNRADTRGYFRNELGL